MLDSKESKWKDFLPCDLGSNKGHCSTPFCLYIQGEVRGKKEEVHTSNTTKERKGYLIGTNKNKGASLVIRDFWCLNFCFPGVTVSPVGKSLQESGFDSEMVGITIEFSTSLCSTPIFGAT